jgi:actin-related protein
MDEDDEPVNIVVDQGTHNLRVGLAGDEFPIGTISTALYRSKASCWTSLLAVGNRVVDRRAF